MITMKLVTVTRYFQQQEVMIRKIQGVANGMILIFIRSIIDMKKDKCKPYLEFSVEKNKCKLYSSCQNYAKMGKYNRTFQVEINKIC